MNKPRPKRDGNPEERQAYEAMVERVVGRAEPLSEQQLTRLAALFRAGRKDVAA